MAPALKSAQRKCISLFTPFLHVSVIDWKQANIGPKDRELIVSILYAHQSPPLVL